MGQFSGELLHIKVRTNENIIYQNSDYCEKEQTARESRKMVNIGGSVKMTDTRYQSRIIQQIPHLKIPQSRKQ
jgi:hypothetical protein